MITGLYTLPSFSRDSISARNSAEKAVSLKAEMEQRGRQLSTGLVSDNYAGLGPERWRSVNLRQSLSALDGYDSLADDATLMTKVFDQTLSRMTSSAKEVAAVLNGGNSPADSSGLTAAQLNIDARFQEVVDLLNTDLNGRRLYGGRKSDSDPVLSADQILNGYTDAGGVARDGLRTLVNQRVAADFNGGDGRLTVTTSPTSNVVGLAHDASAWGFAFGSVTGSAGITAAGTGFPASFTVNAQPADGEKVTVRLALPDGTTKDITLTARAAGSASGTDTFAIGTDVNDTAGRLGAALQAAIGREAASSLKAASAAFTVKDFFTSSTPVRVAGGNTVQWYQGDPGAPANARATAPFRVGDTQTANIGAQANEDGPAALLTAFGMLATAGSFDPSVDTEKLRWTELSGRAATTLSGAKSGLQTMQAQFAVAAGTVATAQDQNKATRATLGAMLDPIENASKEEAATQLLALQTQLQASYQITSMLSKLSLVNYLG